MPLRLSLFAVLFLLFNTSFAEIIHVPDDFASIQVAIRNQGTQDGDTVLIDPGIYNDTLNFIGKDITVASLYLVTGDEDYISSTIIDGHNDHRVVLLRNGETENAKLIGLTIRNGTASYGGGIYVNGAAATPSLSHLIIYGNVATSNGGGIYTTSGAHPTIDQVTIYNNQGDSYGGINCHDSSTVVLTNSIIYGNEPAELPDGLDASFCDVEGGRDGEGNIDVDPQFVNAGEGDFHLNANSGCINAGDPNGELDPDRSRTDIGALSFHNPSAISVDPVQLNYGGIRLNTQVDGTVTITSSGLGSLIVESISIVDQGGAFSIVQGGDAIEIDPGESVRVTIRFSPDQEGDYIDTLQIVSDDPENGEVFVILHGSGLPPAPEIEVDQRMIDYGEVGLRQAVPHVLIVQNTGNAALNIDNATIIGNPSSFSIQFPRQIVVQPGNQTELTLTFQPVVTGDQSDTLRLVSNDEDESVINIPLTGSAVLPDLRYQFTNNTGVNHSILVLSFEIDGDPLVYGSEIGIFNDNGLCCGADYWLGNRLGMAAWGDNDMTEAIDGWRDGEFFSFKAWDLSAGREVIPEIEIVDGDNQFRPNGLSVVRLSIQRAPDGFSVYISNGWGIISAPVNPDELNVVRLWQPVVERRHLVMMKDSGGRFYSALFGFSNMQNWDFRQGYQVRGNAVDSLDLGGNYVAVDTVIPLRFGWNIVAFFPEMPITPQIAFRDIADRITIVKDAFGHFYLPGIGFNNMAMLRRGLGYQVRMSEAADFVWNIPDQQAASVHQTFTSPEHFIEPVPTGLSMSVLLSGDESLMNYEIAALCPDGRVVGATRLSGASPWGMAVWADDVTTPEKDGALSGEAIRLVIFDGTEERPALAEWANQNTFAGDELALVQLSAVSEISLSLHLEAPQPNPFNSRTTIAFSLPLHSQVKLAIYDLSGREISVLAEGKFSAGIHRSVWDADKASSGIYIAKLETAGRTFSTKLTLLR